MSAAGGKINQSLRWFNVTHSFQARRLTPGVTRRDRPWQEFDGPRFRGRVHAVVMPTLCDSAHWISRFGLRCPVSPRR